MEEVSEWIEAYGRTKEEALGRILREFKATKEEVEISVIQEERNFCILRGRMLQRKESIRKLQELLEGVVQMLAPEGIVRLVEVTDEMIFFNVYGDNLGGLIGKKGNTLRAIQFLFSEVGLRLGESRKICVDVGFYMKNRFLQLKKEVSQIVQKVQETGKEELLEPMEPEERAWVYDFVRQFPDLDTRTIGEETCRQIVIFKKIKGEKT
ncbi:MAG: R3H domain-containing nucleic acid-binding protein [bacterium JZ-2024 1]